MIEYEKQKTSTNQFFFQILYENIVQINLSMLQYDDIYKFETGYVCLHDVWATSFANSSISTVTKVC